MKDKFYNFFRFIGECALYGLLFFLAISNALVEIFVVLAFLVVVVVIVVNNLSSRAF